MTNIQLPLVIEKRELTKDGKTKILVRDPGSNLLEAEVTNPRESWTVGTPIRHESEITGVDFTPAKGGGLTEEVEQLTGPGSGEKEAKAAQKQVKEAVAEQRKEQKNQAN